jgi:hypothetical protein
MKFLSHVSIVYDKKGKLVAQGMKGLPTFEAIDLQRFTQNTRPHLLLPSLLVLWLLYPRFS